MLGGRLPETENKRICQFSGVKSGRGLNRELKQRQRHKTIGLMSKNNRSARAFYILVHFLPSSAKQQREMTTFKVLWRT